MILVTSADEPDGRQELVLVSRIWFVSDMGTHRMISLCPDGLDWLHVTESIKEIARLIRQAKRRQKRRWF